MSFSLLLKKYQFGDNVVNIYEPDNTEITNQYRHRLIAFPYWSQVWPSAVALARFLLQHPHYTQGKKVLELAAGLGLPAVVAARNAAFVIASDYEPAAVTTMQQTVTYHNLQNMQVQLLNWFALPTGLAADVLLLSDVSYDSALFEVQEKVIKQFLEEGAVIIVSTPQRLIAKQAVLPLLSHCVYQEEIRVLHRSAEVPVTVMVLQLK